MLILFNQQQEPLDLGSINPNMTVLQWLRGNNHVGTKEGCASGDCGACTAVIGELSDCEGKTIIQYKSINTCIALACSLSGKHLITVEGLSDGNTLHPVQQAMVETNGSQCGFCTPGFVMSLFALYHNEDYLDTHKINDALSGNLCRCTGYQPIISAALLSFDDSNKQNPDYYKKNQPRLIKSLIAIKEAQSEHYLFNVKGKNISYDAPTNINQLSEILSINPSATIIAGGSDLGLDITQQLHEFEHIVNVQGVTEMKIINDTEGYIEIGAAVSYDSAKSDLVDLFPAFESLLRRFASKPIRYWATIGGNIANASPIGDIPPALIALDATLNINGRFGSRKVKVEDFFINYKQTDLQPGEFIQSVIIPKLIDGESFHFHKISRRYEDDISAVCMAIKFLVKDDAIERTRVALGGMAEIPKRANCLEKMLVINRTKTDIAKLAYAELKKDFSPISDVRGSAGYRLQVAANLVKKTLLMEHSKSDINIVDLSDDAIISGSQ